MVFMEVPVIIINGGSPDSDAEAPDDSFSEDEIQIISPPQNALETTNRVEVVSPEGGTILIERMNSISVSAETERDSGRTMGGNCMKLTR